MKHSPTDPVISVRESDGVTDPDIAKMAAARAATVARDLIAIRSLSETEQLALEAMRTAAGRSWSALYRPEESGYRRGGVVGVQEQELPESLETELVEKLLGGITSAGYCDEEDLRHKVAAVSAYARLQGEFDHQPILLLLGGPSDEASPPALGLEILDSVAEVCAIGLRNAELVERLQSEVFVDFVTHCYNRRAFEEHLQVEMVRARRYERPLCLLLLDLDDFKQINDELGHLIGDHALARVGEVLRSTFRTTDRVCRYGGDEFAVIFPETSKEDVLRLAERLCRQISKIFPDTAIRMSITASIGVASYPRDATRPEDLVLAADRALYRAKNSGRNRVVSA